MSANNIVTIVFEDRPFDLERAQALIGGFVELHRLRDGSQMLVNEEGRLKKLPYNQAASLIAGFDIVGPAVVLRGKSRW